MKQQRHVDVVHKKSIEDLKLLVRSSYWDYVEKNDRKTIKSLLEQDLLWDHKTE